MVARKPRQPGEHEALVDLGGTLARVRRRWARQGLRVRQLSAKADEIAKARGTALLRGPRRQVAALEVIREEVGYHHSWGQWSATAEEMGDLVDAILRHPALSIYDLAVKFDALAWLLLADGAVVDHEAERQVRAFARALRKLATVKGKLAS